MSEEIPKTDDLPPIRGRTWADVFVGTTYLLGGLIFLVLAGFCAWYIFGSIPNWFFIAILGSFLFVPFLFERAKAGAELYIVCDEPFKMTEYRIGRKTGLAIEGAPFQFVSNSGTYRTFLSDFDPQRRIGKGTMFAELTQIDQVRDLTTLQRAITTLEETLKESRISSQEVGIEVEKQSIKIVDWALKTIYGAIIPTEISESFGIDEVSSEKIEPVDELTEAFDED